MPVLGNYFEKAPHFKRNKYYCNKSVIIFKEDIAFFNHVNYNIIIIIIIIVRRRNKHIN